MRMKHKNHMISGFTLIELSIVLVIIGLIIGGVLFGKDMIHQAELRGLISQVNQFKIATNQFNEKYKSLLGDMHPSQTAKLGFFTFTGAYAGSSFLGNNNGLVYGAPEMTCEGECGAFWRHLSDAGLVGASYGQTLENDTGVGGGAPVGEDMTTPYSSSLYMPAAKGGFGFFGAGSLLEYSFMSDIPGVNQHQNLFYVVPAAKAERTSFGERSLSAIDAYTIDVKIDDGKPNTGKMLVSTFDNYDCGDNCYWSATVNASSNVCTTGGSDALQTDVIYNANTGAGGNAVSCIPLFGW